MLEERIKYIKALIFYTFECYTKNRSSSVAAELTITSLLAIVPFTTVVFSLLAFIPDFQVQLNELQSNFFDYFVPTTGETVKAYINEFVTQAKKLSVIGLLFLIVTALLMIRAIDQGFNKIWQSQSEKTLVKTFLVYWAILTLGPLLLGSSLFITAYLKSLPMISDVIQGNNQLSSVMLPFLLAAIAFSLMYYVIPNRKIFLKHAVVAGVIAALLFELAKLAFAIFVERFSTYQMIFGTLAVIPLFLIWIYLSWTIILLGAELCHAFGSFRDKASIKQQEVFIQLVKLLQLFAYKQTTGHLVKEQDLMDLFDGQENRHNYEFYLNKLLEHRLIMKGEENNYCLINSKDTLSYEVIYLMSDRKIPSIEAIESASLSQETKKELVSLCKAIPKLFNDLSVTEYHQEK